VVADPEEVDRLEATPASRLTAPAAAVALVIIGVLVALGLASHEPHARSSAPVVPTPSPIHLSPPVALPKQPPHGSVFLQHLDECTRGDREGHVTIALGVTNLSEAPLRLLRATPLRVDNDLRFAGARMGSPPCGVKGVSHSVRLAPAQGAVVTLMFVVRPHCLHDTAVAARLTFAMADHHTLHADSSDLADLSRLHYVSCDD
jgi:hypothetical protein